MEHVRGLSDNNHTMGFGLGLPTRLFLLYKYWILGHGLTNDGPRHIIELDVNEQISEAIGPLHTPPCRHSTLASVYYIWVLTWPDQSSSDALPQCSK